MIVSLAVTLFTSAIAQLTIESDGAAASADSSSLQTRAQSQTPLQTQMRQLGELVSSLEASNAARQVLRDAVENAAGDEKAELELQLQEINQEIRETRSVIEQIAVGSVDLEAFDASSEELDWRTELTQVLLPVVQSLKRLTEKPRRIELLRTRISQATESKENAERAVENISEVLAVTESGPTQDALQALSQSWQLKAQEFSREISLSNVQLDNLLNNNEPLWVRIKDVLTSFFQGRGLTLVLALVVGCLVHYATKIIAKFFAKRQKGEAVTTFRTRRRIIHYGLQAARTLLILISVMLVFQMRGDILLLAIALLIGAGLVLSVRHMLPQFIDELKLLLNLGPIREDERVIYRGLPWKVTQLNLFSELSNPEITGGLRIPIKEMAGLTSRPAHDEPWFPSSENDYLVLSDDRLMKVKKQTPEHVLLENVGGAETMIPTAEFYSTVFENLSRNTTYQVTSVFGIGYSHQKDSVTRIPQQLKQAISSALSESDYAQHLISTNVELDYAGSSSLDFWIAVKMHSASASSYKKIKRLIQQICVETCTKEAWEIPFPQLTLHNS